jgi:uncharacterized membrane protein YhaH (DUF805 family)
MFSLKRFFQGRTNRKNYFIGIIIGNILIFLLIQLLFKFADFFITSFITIFHITYPYSHHIFYQNPFFYFFAIFMLCILPAGLFNYSLIIRRLHDIGLSGWFSLLYILLNGLMEIILIVIPGEKKTNRYGKQPKSVIDLRGLFGVR